MRKKIFVCIFSLAVSAVLAAADVTVAEWDFTKSSVFKNKFKISLRGKSKITPGGLTVPIGAPKERAGAATAAVYPAMSPDGAFSVSVDFALSSKEKRSGKNHVIIDSKNVPATNAKQANYNYGFILYLKHSKGNLFIPTAAFGYQKSSRVITGKAVAISFDKVHNITLVYNAKGVVNVMLDKRSILSGKVQTGKISPAKLPLHFGDRAGADYWPLGGTIRKVVLKKTVVPPKTFKPGQVIASWDFTNQNVLKGKYPVKTRGGRITPAGLAVTNKNVAVPSGAVLTKPYAEISPQQGFEITAEVSLNKDPKRTARAMIFDMKYIPTESLAYHKGFMFYLEPQPRERFRMVGAFGFGSGSVRVKSNEFTPAFGKVEKYSMKFTSVGQVIFYFRGAELSTSTVPSGKIAVSELAPAFGDRIGRSYWPLGGTLKKVSIIAR